MEHGANVNAANGGGQTPLFSSLRLDTPEVMAYLIEHGADVNHQDGHNNTVLMHVVGKGKPDFVKCLVDHGADPTIKCDKGASPLIFAKVRKKQEIIDLLSPPASSAAE